MMESKNQLALLGYSGNALEMFEYLRSVYSIVAFLDDNAQWTGHSFEGVPVLPVAQLAGFPAASVLVTFGSQRSILQRARVVQELGIERARFPTVIHPRATVSTYASLGVGTIIFPGVTVTFNAVIGDHCMILPNSVVHHDVILGDHVLVGSNVTLAGGCRIGSNSYLGSASSVRNGVTVGAASLIGMAANVVSDTKDGAVMIGNPARPMVRS